MIVSGLAVAPIWLAGPAAAEGQVDPSPSSFYSPTLDHRHQTGVSLMPGVGYSVIVPYQEGKDCGDSSGDPNKRVCTSRVPLFVDLQLSFGLSTRIDLITDLRFGVEGQRVTDSRQFAFAPGFRVWIDQDSNIKFYTTIQGLVDSTDQNQSGIPNTDWGVRNSNGLMFDAIRNLGFFFQFGESIGFQRWFRLELDVGGGVQVRFP
jgi:hypothetical protein